MRDENEREYAGWAATAIAQPDPKPPAGLVAAPPARFQPGTLLSLSVGDREQREGYRQQREPDAPVEVEVAPGEALALLYPPHERVGVTYRTTATTCQCEAHADGKPCRHRAKARLVELCQATTSAEETAGSDGS